MFALIGLILSGVWFILTLIESAVPAWMLPAVLGCICAHLAFGYVITVPTWHRRP